MNVINRVNFTCADEGWQVYYLNQYEDYKKEPTEDNFLNLTSEYKLAALHDRLVKLGEQLDRFEKQSHQDAKILSENQNIIQNYAYDIGGKAAREHGKSPVDVIV